MVFLELLKSSKGHFLTGHWSVGFWRVCPRGGCGRHRARQKPSAVRGRLTSVIGSGLEDLSLPEGSGTVCWESLYMNANWLRRKELSCSHLNSVGTVDGWFRYDVSIWFPLCLHQKVPGQGLYQKDHMVFFSLRLYVKNTTDWVTDEPQKFILSLQDGASRIISVSLFPGS